MRIKKENRKIMIKKNVSNNNTNSEAWCRFEKEMKSIYFSGQVICFTFFDVWLHLLSYLHFTLFVAFSSKVLCNMGLCAVSILGMKHVQTHVISIYKPKTEFVQF